MPNASAINSALIRHMVADYLEINEVLYLMGTGFRSLDENPNAQTETTTYINDKEGSTDVIGYEREFPFESDYIPSKEPIVALWTVGRNGLTGDDAKFNYYRVDLWDGEDNAKKARKFSVTASISSFSGEGGAKLAVSGTMHANGAPVQGTFNTSTKTFTETP